MMSNTLHSIKVKLKSKPLISTKDREQLNHAYTVVVTGLETTLRIANQVAGNPGPPGLKAAGISSLLFALDAVKVNALILSIAPTDSFTQKMAQNVQDAEQLCSNAHWRSDNDSPELKGCWNAFQSNN